MSAIQEWRQREVVAEVAGDVERNMQIAAKMVEVDARHRLLRIREPAFGLKYRQVLALYRLTSVVKRSATEVVGAIGMPPGAKGSDYGFWIEVGSKSAPAQPWLRPALLTNLRAILQILAGK